MPIDFPFRDLILTTAFGVTLGTLVLQGLTLRPLLLHLKLEDDGSVDREIRLARVESLRAALAAAAEAADGSSSGGGIDSRDDDATVVRAATEAQRRRLMALRADGAIGDAAFQRVEEELDWAELDWAQLVRAGQREDGEP